MIESTILALGFAVLSSLPRVLAQDAPENPPEESASASASSSAAPSASSSAVPDNKCTVDEKTGKEICGTQSVPGTLPTSAKVAIAIVVLTIVFLLIATFFCIRRSRRASAEAAKDVSVEASQVDGPPAILGATYTPETGHSRVYSIGPDSGGLSAAVPVPLTPAVQPQQPVIVHPSAGVRAGGTPAFPSPSVARSSSFSRFGTTSASSAPAHKANFSDPSYPFTGFGNNASGNSGNASSSGQQPRSAFVSQGGFPRPLLAGRLKDRIRERPPSISSVADSPK